MFLILSIPSAIVIIFLCMGEIEVLCEVLGESAGMKPEFVEITFGSISNSILDMYIIIGATMEGYEEMAFAAVFAAPFFCK